MENLQLIHSTPNPSMLCKNTNKLTETENCYKNSNGIVILVVHTKTISTVFDIPYTPGGKNPHFYSKTRHFIQMEGTKHFEINYMV